MKHVRARDCPRRVGFKPVSRDTTSRGGKILADIHLLQTWVVENCGLSFEKYASEIPTAGGEMINVFNWRASSMVMERSTGSCGRLLLYYATILSVRIRTALHLDCSLMGYSVKLKKLGLMFYMRVCDWELIC